MKRLLMITLAGAGVLWLGQQLAPACSLCPAGQNSLTLRQDAAQAKMVLYGPLANPRLSATDLQIDRVLKSDPFLGNKKSIEIPKFIPVDAKDPPKFLIFCEIINGRLDVYRGMPIKSPGLVDYLKGAIDLDGKSSSQQLQYYFRYLDHADAEIANDAFLEFAKASDKEVSQVARDLRPDKLRKMLTDAQTPANRLGLYAFLLSGCGGEQEADLLLALMKDGSPRNREALGGLLAGYIHLQPRKGWALLREILADTKRPFQDRYAAVNTLRFFYGADPAAYKGEVLPGVRLLVEEGDMADLGIEDLRRWKLWDLTELVLAQYGKKSHDAPIVKRTIVRYGLTCPRPEAVRFIEELRKKDPKLVKEVEESLQFEKK